MEFPFGGHNRHHQREEREEEEQFPPRPLPPQHHHHHHHEHNMPPPQPDLGYSAFPQESLSYPRPPPQPDLGYSAFPQESLSYPRPPPPTQRFEFEPGYPSVHQTNLGPEPGYASVHHVSHQTDLGPEPGYASVQHVSHQTDLGPEPGYASVQHVSHQMQQESEPDPSEFRHETHHQHRPHLPSFVHHHTHEGSEVSNKPTVRVFSKAEPGYSLTIRDGHVILARSNENDEFQHWIKDEKYSTRVKDEEGFPSFALVNKATGQALKHSIGATHPVQLIPYNPDVLDESILWAESKDLGDSFRTIRMVNNIRLNMDAFHGDKNHGGVHDGTTVVLWEWKKGDNQRWKIVPYLESHMFGSFFH